MYFPPQKTFGKRPPMTILNQIQKDCELYESGHARGSKSNKDLHKAMNAHVANLKLISGPLEDIQNSLPNYDSIKSEFSVFLFLLSFWDSSKHLGIFISVCFVSFLFWFFHSDIL